MFFGVPTTFVLMLEKATPEQLKNLRYFFSAAAALPREIEERWLARFGSVIYQGYGLTESSPFATYNHIREHRIGSLGTAIAGVEIAIAKVHDGYTAEAGERGEILIRGANVMLGYWNKPEETAECLREGWLHTGDIGRMDADGYLTIEDRLKDMVIVGGTNVFPAEVEQVLYQHGSVLEAAVYGRPDAVLGELVCAAVVLRPEAAASEEMLVRFCSERLAEFKVPTAIEFVSELPKGPTGKVLKRLLREHCAVVNAPERMMPRSTEDLKVITNVRELEARILHWLSETLHVKAGFLKRNTPFGEYGVTSLMAVELAGRLCGWLGKAVPPTVAWRFSTVAALARHYFPEPETPPQAQLPVGDLLAHLSDVEAETLLLRELARLGIDGGRA
jgi:long-chain acyl-CoA synthetase